MAGILDVTTNTLLFTEVVVPKLELKTVIVDVK